MTEPSIQGAPLVLPDRTPLLKFVSIGRTVNSLMLGASLAMCIKCALAGQVLDTALMMAAVTMTLLANKGFRLTVGLARRTTLPNKKIYGEIAGLSVGLMILTTCHIALVALTGTHWFYLAFGLGAALFGLNLKLAHDWCQDEPNDRIAA